MSFHDTNPVHHAQGEISFKREGDTILVYPGPARLTLSEWASAVAFTTTAGDTSETHKRVLDLLEASPEAWERIHE